MSFSPKSALLSERKSAKRFSRSVWLSTLFVFLEDLQLLGARIQGYQPIVLTGLPKVIAEAPASKRAWVQQISRSRGQRGDILIDDSAKYHKSWIKAGGIWITHRSADAAVAIIDVMEV